jgi:tRNA threonylcarbamoyladenosine biosynthesis protein TsaE
VNWRRVTHSAPETARAGHDFAALLRPGDVVLLDGPLGAGKTTFTQGLARGLGVTERVTSPTFTLVREHRCGPGPIRTLHHADLYRLERIGEVLDLGLGELDEDHAVAIIEWGERTEGSLGNDVLAVDFEVTGDESRVIVVSGTVAERRAADLARWAT